MFFGAAALFGISVSTLIF